MSGSVGGLEHQEVLHVDRPMNYLAIWSALVVNNEPLTRSEGFNEVLRIWVCRIQLLEVRQVDLAHVRFSMDRVLHTHGI